MVITTCWHSSSGTCVAVATSQKYKEKHTSAESLPRCIFTHAHRMGIFWTAVNEHFLKCCSTPSSLRSYFVCVGFNIQHQRVRQITNSTLVGWLSVYANHPWLVTEPEAVGVPGWQTGTKASCPLQLIPQVCKPVHRALNWLTTALMESNAPHTILAPGAWQTLCQSQPLLSIKDL